MFMMKRLCLALVMICIVLPVFAEEFLSFGFGTAGFLGFSEPCLIYPDVRFLFGFDHFSTLSEQWSLLVSCAGNAFLRPTDQFIHYLYSGLFVGSFREGDFFLKASLTAKGEQYFANEIGVPDILYNSVELHVSYDIDDLTLFFKPAIVYDVEDFLEDNVLISGELGATFLLGERLITTGKVNGGMALVPLNHTAYSCGAEADFSYYPDIPLIASVSLGARLFDSDYMETVNTVDVQRLDHVRFFVTPDVTFSFSDAVTLKAILPLKLTYKAMNAIRNGGFTGEREWVFIASPEMELSVTVAKQHKIICTAKGEPLVSNSDYYEKGYVELSVNYQLDF